MIVLPVGLRAHHHLAAVGRPPQEEGQPMADLLLPGEFFDAVVEPLALLQPQDEDPPQPPFAVLHNALLIQWPVAQWPVASLSQAIYLTTDH